MPYVAALRVCADGAAYAVAGSRTSRTLQPSGTASNYTYDNIYQLTGVTQNSTTTESYTYDPGGNRLCSLGVSSYINNPPPAHERLAYDSLGVHECFLRSNFCQSS